MSDRAVPVIVSALVLILGAAVLLTYALERNGDDAQDSPPLSEFGGMMSKAGRIPVGIECRVANTPSAAGYRCYVEAGVPAGAPSTNGVVYRMAYTEGSAPRTTPVSPPLADPVYVFNFGVRDNDPTTSNSPVGVSSSSATSGERYGFITLPQGWAVSELYTRGLGGAREQASDAHLLITGAWGRSGCEGDSDTTPTWCSSAAASPNVGVDYEFVITPPLTRIDWGRQAAQVTWEIPPDDADPLIVPGVTLGVYVDIDDTGLNPSPSGGPYHGYIQYDTIAIESPTPTPTPAPMFTYTLGVRDEDGDTVMVENPGGEGLPEQEYQGSSAAGSLFADLTFTSETDEGYITVSAGWEVTAVYVIGFGARSADRLSSWTDTDCGARTWCRSGFNARSFNLWVRLEFVVQETG